MALRAQKLVILNTLRYVIRDNSKFLYLFEDGPFFNVIHTHAINIDIMLHSAAGSYTCSFYIYVNVIYTFLLKSISQKRMVINDKWRNYL